MSPKMLRSTLPFFHRSCYRKMSTTGHSKSRFVHTTPCTYGANQKGDVLAGADPEQVRLMAEQVILVDESDKVVGSMSKKDSHLVKNGLPLHRAFSVLLFDTKGRMLLQQRADEKVTFPSYWTNTVCSHPLYRPTELGEKDGGDAVMGAKHAAVRKLSHELGVKKGAMSTQDLHFMTKIHYRSECDDNVWGEHELDYIFVAQKDVEVQPEPNEVQKVRFVTKTELHGMFDDVKTSDSIKITPWFGLIMDNFGWSWWESISEGGMQRLKGLHDHNIHNYTG